MKFSNLYIVKPEGQATPYRILNDKYLQVSLVQESFNSGFENFKQMTLTVERVSRIHGERTEALKQAAAKGAAEFLSLINRNASDASIRRLHTTKVTPSPLIRNVAAKDAAPDYRQMATADGQPLYQATELVWNDGNASDDFYPREQMLATDNRFVRSADGKMVPVSKTAKAGLAEKD